MRILLGLAVLAVLAAPAAALADSQIGQVSKRQYAGAIGQRAGLGPEKLLPYTNVYSEQVVRTPAQSETQLRFLDDTILQVGQMSEVVLDHYVYDAAARTGEMTARFGTGFFRFVTGKMRNKDGFLLTTPTVAITIRGTDFRMHVNERGATVIAVLEGAVFASPLGGGAGAAAGRGQSVTVETPGANAIVSQGDAVGTQIGLGDPASVAAEGGDSGSGGGGSGGSGGGGHGGN
ncbi:MAG: FecR family protein [Alphaproteobacteria bacterium]